MLMVANAQSQSSLQRVIAPYRSTIPQYVIEVDRVKTQTLGVTLDQVFDALAGYLGSAYVDQFNKFGRTFQIYVQANSKYRLRIEDINLLTVRNTTGDMVPLGTLISIKPVVGASLISLYNLYPSATIVALPGTRRVERQAMNLMEQIAAKTLPPGAGFSWTAMSYQEKIVGNQMFIVFGLAILLGLSCARGPIRELVHADLGDPRGAAGARRSGGRAAGPAAGQQSLRPDRAGAADRAVGQERHPDRGGGARVARSTAATSSSRRSRRRAPASGRS